MTAPKQVLDEFQKLFTATREREQSRFQTLLAVPVDLVALVKRKPVTPESLALEFSPLRDEINEVVKRIISPASQAEAAGSLAELQAVTAQGDFADRIRRAKSIRYSSYARRSVHAAARRKSHAVDGGYLDRRVLSRIAIRLKSGSNINIPPDNTIAT